MRFAWQVQNTELMVNIRAAPSQPKWLTPHFYNRCRHDGLCRLRSRACSRRHKDERQLSSLCGLPPGRTREYRKACGGNEEAKWGEGDCAGGGDKYVEPLVRVGDSLFGLIGELSSSNDKAKSGARVAKLRG